MQIARFMKDNFVEKSQRQRRIASYAVFCNPSAGWKIFSQLHDFDGLAAELPTMSIDRATRCLQVRGLRRCAYLPGVDQRFYVLDCWSGMCRPRSPGNT